MKCLTVGWVGTSKALTEVRTELEAYGHRCADEGADLVIDDGSQPLPMRWACTPRLSLRLGIGSATESGLPVLQMRSYNHDHRLVDVLDVAEEPSGNGQHLCRRTTRALVEWVALQVSRFARDPQLCVSPTFANDWPDLDLQSLDALAYLHRFNCTADPELLRAAQVPIIERLQTSLITFAERPALNVAGEVVTYRQLQTHAWAIQQRLAAVLEGVEGSAIVGVCLEKSAALYASILAILGCGAVYLPLAAQLPLRRQQVMLESAGARVLLDEGSHPLRERFMALDVRGADRQDASQPLPHPRPDPSAPCVVLFTSGTSGRPKGVRLSQGNLAHFTAWFGGCMELSEQSRVLQFAALNFDASLMDIFPSLIAGAQLIIPGEAQRRDPQQLVELIRQQHITHAFLPPALLGILPLDEPLGLTHLLTGGEACEPHVIERLAGQCHLHNLYGPTEATVLVTHRLLQRKDGNTRVGRPIANSQALILDEDMQPVDEQVMGELYIVGPGVSLGYLSTAPVLDSPFVELTLPDGQVVRAYRSGDLAKWTDDGIELGGRRDDQVKIRGVRIEPREIEQCLRDSRLFRQVAVVIERDGKIRGVVAYPEAGATLVDLKQHARQWLPDYLQPQVWAELSALPCSGSGKIDRQALLALPIQASLAGNGRTAHTPLQRQLARLWSELLRVPVDDLRLDDSFFNLGGHSILLSTLLLSIREQFGRSVPLNHFFERPTISTLALLMQDSALPDAAYGQAVRDAQREQALRVLPETRAGDRRKVIVTGANSFIGVHAVEALLAGGATAVACLVRELPGQPAASRFSEALKEYRLEHLDTSRVRVYPADVSQPRLGLACEVYDALARDFGVLVHNAAQVNHVMDYGSLVPDNVDPVRECLRLCETHCKKVLNFISTLSACSSIDAEGYVLELPAAATLPIYIKNGYNLSKWVAERLLGRAVAQGAWVNILRPGNISFNSRNGVCQPRKNRLMLMLKGSLQLGLMPRQEVNFDLMPVDFFARFLAFHCGQFDSERSVFNLHNPQPLSWDDYLNAFSQAGHAFDRVTVVQWQQALRTVDRDNALFGVLGFYMDGPGEDIGDTSMIRFDNARHGVEQMGTHYPEKSPALLRQGCEYLKAVGFL
ncbi:amino acid adenylation domain-containing protein [Pseudomonas sp. MH9.3]|uniref:amino acid adenylation domain-containing protein n=1 Tax=Pseudomonas sp. MH9.3 TaxID=3048630 RepID=UPI002AC8DBE0|nr:amino acid adenylation domain-containing protein [Pseudomonas sp. MH9.3]MEB0108438.1 amino acid adenylation domain-containing protein [Pseudomonas sp. MH9.3]WPX77940.1 amino acid adenylation domain-containing protein [Pseudomonas sp. MH9.3]